MSTQYSASSCADHTGHSPSSARASRTHSTSVIEGPASSDVSFSSIRRWMASASSSQPNTHTVAIPSNARSRKVAKNSSQSRSPLPISLCWWIRASTPGGLMM